MVVKETRFIGSFISEDQCPEGNTPEFAFIGRSNVGKSSLINMLCNSKNLVKVSGTPGKTQAINFFLINHSFHFVDLPGYGFAKASHKNRAEWQKMIKNYITNRKQLLCLFVLIDSRHEPQKIDLEFINNMGKWEVPFTVVFTKMDKVSRNESFRNMKLLENELKPKWEVIPPFFRTSSEKNEGRDELLGYIENILEQPKENFEVGS